MFKKLWNKIKDWSGWSTAGSIFLARLHAMSGFAIGVIGGLNWTPLLSLDLSSAIASKTFLAVGGVILLQGIFAEVVRRHNAQDI